MEYAVFESRVMELLFKTSGKLTPQLVAFRVGCPVDVARKYLEHMAATEVLVMEVDSNGVIQYDIPGRPPPTNEPLSWLSGGGPPGPVPHTQPSPGGPVHQHGVAPVNIQIHNAAQPQVVVVGNEKSAGLAAVLGLFFGPLGMLYSTGVGALIMFLVSLLLVPVTFGAGLLITAPICALWAAHAASEHNKKLRASLYAVPAVTHHIQAPPYGQLPPPPPR